VDGAACAALPWKDGGSSGPTSNNRPFLGADAELLQLAVQRAAFHSDEVGGAADVAAVT
jgi:hypothetical protein